jgi:hypothetical protein
MNQVLLFPVASFNGGYFGSLVMSQSEEKGSFVFGRRTTADGG